MIIAGVDIGLSGAIAFLDEKGRFVGVHDMPIMQVGNKREIDEDRVKELFGMSQLGHVFFEKAQSMPGQGIASTGHYLTTYGLVRGICKGVGVPYSLVHPATWKKAMMKDMPKEKAASIYRVQQYYPGAGLHLKKDHGKADAILIALYGLSHVLKGGVQA